MLEDVYREQYAALVAFVSARTRDRARAEEIVQEAFVRAIEHQPDNPRAWLYSVASNLARDSARRSSVRRAKLRVVRDETARSGVEPSVDERFASEERHERLRAVLATLGSRDRDALLMKESGASYDDIAEQLGIARASVGTTLSRARARLSRAWAGASEEVHDAAR